MKILFFLMYPLFGSGSGTYARKLVEKLSQLYPEDKIALLCPDSKKIKGVKVYPLELPIKAVATGHPDWPEAKLFSRLTSEEIDRLYLDVFFQTIKAVEDFQPDVIHVHHAFYFTWIANYIRAIHRREFLVTVHGTGLLSASEDKRWIPLTKEALGRAYLINAVSNDTKKWLLKIYGRRLNCKTRIITGGIDIETYSHNAPIKIINKKYHLTGKKVVIFVGKLENHKGVEYLLKAAPKIKAEIYILGGGTDKERLEKMSKNLNLENVHFMGYFGSEYIKELREFYRRADVFVFPSTWDEPLGLVALEAMASSTPVVASNKGGIPLAVKDGINGFLIRAKSHKLIAEKVNYLLDNPDIKEKMGQAARKIVEEKFSWSNIAERFHKYYEQAARLGERRRQEKRLPIDITREKTEIKRKTLGVI